MSDLIWRDFSGAPPLLIPASAASNWQGLYVPCDEKTLEPDLVLPDGRLYLMRDDLDFDRPGSDYERVCAHTLQNGGHSLFSVRDLQTLVISDYSDGAVGWWPEQQMILTVSRHKPELDSISDSQWVEPIEWEVKESEHRLINAACHGADPDLSEDQDYLKVHFEPGKYLVDACDYEREYCMMIYRFRRQ